MWEVRKEDMSGGFGAGDKSGCLDNLCSPKNSFGANPEWYVIYTAALGRHSY